MSSSPQNISPTDSAGSSQHGQSETSNGVHGQREAHTNSHWTLSEADGGNRPVAPANRNAYATTSANVQVGLKKRKRAFANRTKTGCQTCRKRKKKCDEGKPTCNNCERGGFLCEGYTHHTAFHGTTAPKQHPTPIQPKNSFQEHDIPLLTTHFPSSIHKSSTSIAQRSLDTLSGISMTMPSSSFQSERDKMRHGEEYNWMDPQLRHDREVCRVLLSYFNNSASSISPGERERQLRLILESDVKPQMHSPTPSRLGKNVSVETPFRCDYGYSLNIRDHVVIEAGCVIMDAAEVEIREGAHIGTDVRITSKVVPQDPRARVDRLGGQIRKAKGIRVIIEESVYIGDGALIAPEWDAKGGGGDDDDGGLLRIGMNSYILPGTIVRKNIPANMVYRKKERDGPDVRRCLGSSYYTRDAAGRANPLGSVS